MPKFIPHCDVSLSLFETNQESLDAFKTATEYILKLSMGPYEANGIIRHRNQRLKGLQDSLSKSGYYTELITTPHLNRFSMVFYNREIFRCNIKNFQFNIPAEEDPLCKKVLNVLQEHEARICKEENIPKFVNIDHGMRFINLNKFMTTADMLPDSDIQLLYEIKNYKVKEAEEPQRFVSISDQYNQDSGQTSVSFSENQGKEEEERRKQTTTQEEALQGQWMTPENIDTATETSTEESQRHRLSTAVTMDIEDAPFEHEHVFRRITKNLRIRRASYMYKSHEIRSTDGVSFESLASVQYEKPETKNQKIIAKIMHYKKEKVGRVKKTVK